MQNPHEFLKGPAGDSSPRITATTPNTAMLPDRETVRKRFSCHLTTKTKLQLCETLTTTQKADELQESGLGHVPTENRRSVLNVEKLHKYRSSTEKLLHQEQWCRPKSGNSSNLGHEDTVCVTETTGKYNRSS